jgi:hypothetical protein
MAELSSVLNAIRNAEAAGDTPAVLRLTQLARDISAQTRAQQAPREMDYPEENRRLSGYLGTIPRGIAAGIAGLGESALLGASNLLPEEQELAARAAITRGGAAVQEAIGPKELYRDTLVSKLSQGLGSTVPFLAAAPFGVPGLIAAGATGVAAGSGEATQRAIAAGATEEEIGDAALLGIGPGALEMFAPLAIVKRFGTLKKALGSGTATDVVSRLRRVAQSAGEEGLQEAVTEIGQNLIAQGVYDPNTGTFSGTGESFGLGAGVGGLLQGLFELALPRPRGALNAAERSTLGLDGEPQPTLGLPSPEAQPLEGDIVGPEQILAGPPEPQERVGLPAPRPEAIVVAPDGTAFPERYMDDYRAYRRERNAELAAAAPETRQAREATLAQQFLATKEAEEAAAITEAARLRREAPQMEMFPELQGEEKTKVTVEDLTKLGIPKTSRFATTLPKLDLTKPEEARTAAAEIVRYANLPTTKKNPARREAAFGLLNLPAIRALEATAPTAPPTSIEEASRQMSIQEPIATSRIEEQRAEEAARIAAERDAAFAAAETARVAQEAAIPQQTEAAFEEARDRRREELLAADTRARMATPEAGAITSPVALALERAKTAGGQRPGQAQLEIQDNVALSTGQQDSFSPEAVGTVPTQQGPTIDEQIAEAQRVLARLETQKAEQGEMFGPRGRVLSEAERFDFTREGDAEAADARAQEREITALAKKTSTARKSAATKAANKEATEVKKKKEEAAAKKAKADDKKAADKRAADKEAAKVKAAADKRAKEAAEKKAAKDKATQDIKENTAARSAAAAAAAPVVEEDVVEDVEVTDEVVEAVEEDVGLDSDPDLDVLAADLQAGIDAVASRKAKNKDSKPKKASKRAANIAEDTELAKKLKPGDPFYEYFKKGKSIEGGLGMLAMDVADPLKRNDAVIAAELWVKNNLSKDTISFFGDQVRFSYQIITGKQLPRDSMLKTSEPLSSDVIAKLEAGDLRGAINELAKSTDANVARVAKAISKGLGNTKIVMASKVVNDSGEPVSGLYDPTTDTITLNQDVDLSNHVLLHEATHAVTSHELAKDTPAARQMRALFESVRGTLDSAYGATNVDEFVAEAFSNPEFQAKLAGISDKGEKITLWDKFKNIIENIVRRFRGQPSKKVESALDKVDMLVADLISPAPEYRNATVLPLASIKGMEKETVDQLGKFVKDKVSAENIAAVSGFMRDTGRFGRKQLLDMLPLPAIANVIERDMPQISKLAKDLVNKIQDKAGTRQRYLRQVNDTAAALNKVFKGKPDQKKKFDKIIGESTLARVDPSKPRSYYKDKGAGKLEEYDRLQKQWRELSPESKKAYATLRDAYAKMYEELKKTLSARIDAIEKDPNLNKQLKDRVLGEILGKEAIEPYFPLHRKGDYWLQYNAVNPATGNIEPYKEAFESEASRQVAKEQILNDPEILDALRDPKVNQSNTDPEKLLDFTEYDRIDEAKKIRQGNVDTAFAFKLLNEIRRPRKDDKTGKPIKLDKQTEKMVLEMLLDAMPERGLARALQQREGVLGFEKDALKTFRERMPNIVTQTVNLQYETDFAQLSQELSKARGEAINAPGITPEGKINVSQTVGHLEEYIEFAKYPQLNTFSRLLKSAGFAMTLGLNVSSVLVNWTNLPVVVLPYLSGKYGFKDANRALFDAHKRFLSTSWSRTMTGFGDTVFGTAGEGPSLTNVDYSDPDISPELKQYEVLAELLDRRGQANVTMTSDALDMENPANSVWTKVNAMMGYMFHQGERLNRQVSAMATFDLEVKRIADKKYGGDTKKLTDADKQDAAQEALDATELTNSGALTETAPRFAQSNLGSVIFMYKRFGVSMLYLQARMANQAMASLEPSELKRIADAKYDGDESKLTDKDKADAKDAAALAKSIAKKQIVGLFASSALLAGVQGLPLYGVVAFIMNTAFLGDEDEDFDTIASTFFGEGMYSGAINAITGADVAPRIGMTNLVFRSLPNKEQDSLILQGLEMLGGPVYGVADRAFSGIGLLSEGEVWRGFEKMVPSFASNVMKSVRYGTDGVTTLRGDPIVEDIGPLAIGAQAIGLAPASYTQMLERNAVDKRIDRNVNARRTKLLRKYYIAKRSNDLGSMRSLQKDMREFNKDNPDFQITAETIDRSLAQHERTSDVTKQFGGVTISPRRRESVLKARMEAAGEEY